MPYRGMKLIPSSLAFMVCANDLQVILDTLAIALPYETARRRACREPKPSEKKAFIGALKKHLAPFVPVNANRAMVIEAWEPTESLHARDILVRRARSNVWRSFPE